MNLQITNNVLNIIDVDLNTIKSVFGSDLEEFLVQMKQGSQDGVKTYYMRKDKKLYRYNKISSNKFEFSGTEEVTKGNPLYQFISRLNAEKQELHTYKYDVLGGVITRDDSVTTYLKQNHSIPSDLSKSITLSSEYVFGWSWKDGSWTVYLDVQDKPMKIKKAGTFEDTSALSVKQGGSFS